MSDSHASSTRPTATATDTLLIALVSALLTGLLEAGWLTFQRQVEHTLTYTSLEVEWMTPVAYLALFLGPALLLALVARVLRGRVPLALPLCAFIALGVFSLLLLFLAKKISLVALGLIALGLGVQLTRVLIARAGALRRGVRVAAGGLTLLTLLLAAGTAGWRAWRGHRIETGLGAVRPGAPNVLLIILDTVRSTSLSLYGYARPTTPELTRWAARGVVFDSAMAAAPWTLPSHASIFTGEYHHGISADWLRALDHRPRTLAETFQAAGYRTAGFVANLYYTSHETGLTRGFQQYQDYQLVWPQILRTSILFQTIDDLYTGVPRVRRSNVRKLSTTVSQQFLGWLDRHQDRPFFVFLNYFDAHLPLKNVPADSPWNSGRRKVDRYDAAIARLDGDLSKLLAELDRRGVLQNTIVMISSDHGELLGEHGLFQHGNCLYLPLLHVPLVAFGPGIPVGARVTRVVSLRDVAATLTDVAGVVPAEAPSGHSLARLWQPAAADSSPISPALSEVTKGINTPPEEPASRGTMYSVVGNGMQYILNGDGAEELYRLGSDPDEKTNLAADPATKPDLDRLRAVLPGEVPRGWRPPVPGPLSAAGRVR